MNELKQFLKVNYKGVIMGFALGLIVAGTTVYAITVAGNTVTYDNTSSELQSK